ncbi:PEP-CTERM sorting domain-containing protein [Mucisphaera sp.]|uniref:PEP-CTERM sorting domain-containing protein n=1 Tax=Mucisphaera sp. TaxID=2913024 RepID=UPI003D0D9AFF
MNRSVALALVCLSVGVGTRDADAVSFQGLGDLPGGSSFSSVQALSGDGRVAVGSSGSLGPAGARTEAFLWRPDLGMIGLGDLPGGRNDSFALGVNGDGSVVVGYSGALAGDGQPKHEAFRWTFEDGMSGLGDLPGGEEVSFAQGVSGDGQTVVGYSGATGLNGGNRVEGFAWQQGTGMVGLGDLPGGTAFSRAYAASDDGSVIVGYSESSRQNGSGRRNEAFVFTADGGMSGLGDLPGGDENSIALDVSADGGTVVGFSSAASRDPFGRDRDAAFIWTSDTGMRALGDLAGGSELSRAYGVSADGSVVVGEVVAAGGGMFEAFIWREGEGMRLLNEYLVDDLGLDLAGWRLGPARGVSDDGLTVAGTGVNPSGQMEGWIARLGEPVPTPSTGVWIAMGVWRLLSCRRDSAI